MYSSMTSPLRIARVAKTPEAVNLRAADDDGGFDRDSGRHERSGLE